MKPHKKLLHLFSTFLFLIFCITGADLVAALLLAAPSAGPVSLSVINGRVIVRDGKILTMDVPSLVAEAETRSARLVAMLTPAAIGAGVL